MKCYVGFGSNMGNRKLNIENAAKALKKNPKANFLRASPVLETSALLPHDAPMGWNRAYLNTVGEVQWNGTPHDFLQCLKEIEQRLGRQSESRWAPRIIDLDLLSYGNEIIVDKHLKVPHPEAGNRQFVLTPLKHLKPSLQISDQSQTVLNLSRSLPNQIPLWMGIINLTPDSFSDSHLPMSPETIESRLTSFENENIQIIDLGAESTRPDAQSVSPEEEWKRLSLSLEVICKKLKEQIFRPLISVDTYHPETALQALSFGADIINDVSGLKNAEMLDVLKNSQCQYVLMHSLSVPVNSKIILQSEKPTDDLKNWALRAVERLDKAGINLDRVIFDPGIGFGKTPEQSFSILQNIGSFLDLPVRILVGHSRKSFLRSFTAKKPSERDIETVGISLRLAEKGVDILRVHAPEIHQRAFRAYQEIA